MDWLQTDCKGSIVQVLKYFQKIASDLVVHFQVLSNHQRLKILKYLYNKDNWIFIAMKNLSEESEKIYLRRLKDSMSKIGSAA